ncbi:MAG: dihydroorotate dehydrogenase electron transfer subunit [Candidatus Firestonebacteria bacterium]
MMHLLDAKIIFNKKVSKEYYNLRLLADVVSKESIPGQFMAIKVNNLNFPLLRRPMSIYKINPPFIEILYKIKGDGTKILSKKETGEILSIMGPLGNGFDLKEDFKIAVLIGGGYGLSPLVALNQKLQSIGKKTIIIIGAKTKELIYKKDFNNAKICTDDGSLGLKGMVTDLLKKTCKNLSNNDTVIFACGPKEMLKKVSLIAKKNKIRCQVSMEELMGCGIGVCLSCVCASKSKGNPRTFWCVGKINHKRVCIDGPVFDAAEIIW